MMHDLIIRSRGSSPNVSSVHRGYSCGSCDVMAPTRPALRKHIADCHPALSGTETGETKRCPSTGCDFTTNSRCEMETHVAAHVAQGMTPTGKKRSLALQRVRYRYSNTILHIYNVKICFSRSLYIRHDVSHHLLFYDATQIRERGVSVLAVLIRVHDREGVPETPAGAREGHRAGN